MDYSLGKMSSKSPLSALALGARAPRLRRRLAQQRAELGGVDVGRRVVARVVLVADEAALVELQHAAAHAVDHRRVVRGDQHGRAGAVDAVEQLHDPDRRLGVEVAGRLVGQQQRRVVDERARHGDALLLATAELVGVGVQLGRQAGEAQDVGDLGADLLAALAGDLQRVGDVVVHRAVGQQLEVLEDDPDVAAVERDLLARDLGEVAAGDADRAGSRLDLLDQQLHEGGLARAGGPDQEDELASLDRERRGLEPPVGGPVGLRHAAELDDRRRPILRPRLALQLRLVAFDDRHGLTDVSSGRADPCRCTAACKLDCVGCPSSPARPSPTACRCTASPCRGRARSRSSSPSTPAPAPSGPRRTAWRTSSSTSSSRAARSTTTTRRSTRRPSAWAARSTPTPRTTSSPSTSPCGPRRRWRPSTCSPTSSAARCWTPRSSTASAASSSRRSSATRTSRRPSPRS